MLDSLQKWFKDYLTQKDFKKRLIIMNIGVFFMGFFLSFLIKVNLGTDPCTFMNLTISRFLGISFGNWQLLLNSVLFRVEILEFYSKQHRIKKQLPVTKADAKESGYSEVHKGTWICAKINLDEK